MNKAMLQPRKRRHGLSLLEVLISIGIVSIGMMGVMLILPVAGYRAGQGALADSRSMNGLNWVDEFRARGMAQPSMWIGPGINPTNPIPPSAFLIDPQFFARHSMGTVDADGNDPKRFPYASNVIVGMNRISLRNWPAHLPGSTVLSKEAADQIFQSHDDLITIVPNDLISPTTPGNNNPDVPPQQEVLEEAGNPQKRASTGKVSWMAMLSRGAADTFRLSIIVMDSRDNDMFMGAPVGTVPEEDTDIDKIATERVSVVTDFPGGGIRGGDVTLTAAPGGSGVAVKGALAVRNDDWVLLSANSAGGPVHQWYRVVARDPEIQGDATSGFTRDVTLQGPDWRLGPASATPGSTRLPQATIVTGVIGVFEKTIRLEEPSIWTVD